MYASHRERTASALAAFAAVLLIACGLVFGLRVGRMASEARTLVSVFVDPPKPPLPPPPPRPKPRPATTSAAKDAPSPRNLRNQATPIVAPPVVALIVPPPVVAATQAGTGAAASTGASDQAGPGQGAGGMGNGTGGGGNGGDGEGAVVGPRQVRGHLSFGDLPDGLLAPGREGAVGVRYAVLPDGSVGDCYADIPSRIPALDVLTCRLIRQRFRFRPARDAAGRPVRSMLAETHTWVVPAEEHDGD